MKAYKEKSWQFQFADYDERSELFGVPIFKQQWIDTGKHAQVIDPIYGVTHSFSIYNVVIDGVTYEFAAGEFSNCVWGFYMYEY